MQIFISKDFFHRILNVYFGISMNYFGVELQSIEVRRP